MANNFRLTGIGSPIYFSKDGDDLDTGLTPDDPKITLFSTSGNMIVGSGVYKGAFSFVNTNDRLYADGACVINCTANLAFGITNKQNLELNGDSAFLKLLLNGFSFNVGGSTIASVFANNVIVENGGMTLTTLNAYLTFEVANCVFESVIQTPDATGRLEITKSLFFNSVLELKSANETLKNSYVDAATTINMATYFATPNTDFINNNFQGQFNIGGVLYELKKDKAGSAIDPNPAINDLVAIDANVYTNGNFSQDPQFNNIEKRDYKSVLNTSPNLFAADDSTSIGGVMTATTFTTSDSEINTGALTDVVLSSGDYIVDLPATTGQNVNTAMQIAPIAQVVENIDFATLLNYDSLQTKGTAENTMIAIVDNFTAGTAGANPRRLSYKMRWSDADAQPSVDADWTNNGFVTAGDYSKFEQFVQPLVDVASLGNGDPAFNTTGASAIKAKWIQVIEVQYDGIG